MAQKGIIDNVSGFLGDFDRARRAASLYRELSILSDAGLKARGLSRDQLTGYVFDRAFKNR